MAGIRYQQSVSHDEVVGAGLASPNYHYQRHYLQGMRSHVIEVIPQQRWDDYTNGVVIDELRQWPKPVPVAMLRILKEEFAHIDDALAEARKTNLLQQHMDGYVAKSLEFIAGTQNDFYLCGSQKYIKGEIFGPWGAINLKIDSEKTRGFVTTVKNMVIKTGYIPDLVGNGNIIVSENGSLTLVDINNIQKVGINHQIKLDNKLYPIVDLSIEALFRIEQMIGSVDDWSLYNHYRDPVRINEVTAIEKEWTEKNSTPLDIIPGSAN